MKGFLVALLVVLGLTVAACDKIKLTPIVHGGPVTYNNESGND